MVEEAAEKGEEVDFRKTTDLGKERRKAFRRSRASAT